MVKSHIEGNAKRRAELTLYTEPYTNEIKRINADIERLEKSKKKKKKGITTEEALAIDRTLARKKQLLRDLQDVVNRVYKKKTKLTEEEEVEIFTKVANDGLEDLWGR